MSDPTLEELFDEFDQFVADRPYLGDDEDDEAAEDDE